MPAIVIELVVGIPLLAAAFIVSRAKNKKSNRN
jgi:hypothetical protein